MICLFIYITFSPHFYHRIRYNIYFIAQYVLPNVINAMSVSTTLFRIGCFFITWRCLGKTHKPYCRNRASCFFVFSLATVEIACDSWVPARRDS